MRAATASCGRAASLRTLSAKKLPTEEAETVLHWLQEMQRKFEERYHKLLTRGLRGVDLGYTALESPPQVGRRSQA